MKMRSNSGLTLHMNENAFRQYTDYNPDGSPRSPTFGNGIWSSLDGLSTSLRRNFGPPLAEAPPAETWPIPDLLGRELFQMVLGSAAASQRFYQFAQRAGCGPDVEFLLRVHEYSRAAAQFGRQASSVPTPRNLPTTVSNSLNADMKQLTSTVLPGLEMLFSESARCVEKRVAPIVFPAFVKQQLANCTSASLVSGGGGARGGPAYYPGLAESFCLADVLTHDQPLVAASDAFVSVTGYPRAEALSRNCRFLQGSLTDRSTVERLRDNVLRQEESLELVLNYRRDGTPYWNLLFTCPLLDSAGKLRYYLGGQIDVSRDAGDYKDLVVRVLSSAPASEEARAEGSSGSGGRESRSGSRMSHASGGGGHERKQERRRSLRSQDMLHGKGPRKSFFPPFRRHAAAGSSAESLEHPSPHEVGGLGLGLGLGLESLPTRLIIVRNSDCLPEFPPRSSSLPAADPHRRKPAQLGVAFCSAAALDALGIRHLADGVTHRDIFAVLSEMAESPSVNKSFKNTVRERVVRDGRSATLDVTLGGGYLGRKGSLMGFGGGGGGGGHGRSSSSKDNCDAGTRRQGQHGSRSGFAGLVDAGKADKFTTHWTPLKNAEDKVEWIVVVITPAA
ncbi:hypothetical protein LX36DRAFT_566425 [Colletotrichum falcatum]|nr:hypothetical protein LX36DRAFT_566425 [Colletotrichum falcatum]